MQVSLTAAAAAQVPHCTDPTAGHAASPDKDMDVQAAPALLVGVHQHVHGRVGHLVQGVLQVHLPQEVHTCTASPDDPQGSCQCQQQNQGQRREQEIAPLQHVTLAALCKHGASQTIIWAYGSLLAAGETFKKASSGCSQDIQLTDITCGPSSQLMRCVRNQCRRQGG